MRVFGDEQQLCPCYKECQEFRKLVELKDSALVVYLHRPRKEDIRPGGAVQSAVNTSRDIMFILHNKEDEIITTSELFSELETKDISCPRCRKTFDHAQKLMQEVKSIDRKIVMGICDHCSKKTTAKTATTAKTIKKPLCACDEIVKKFISVKGEQKEGIKKYVKIWLSKMGHLLKDDITPNKPKQVKTRAYSDLQINRGFNSPASKHEPEIQQMENSGMHKSDINLNTEMTETHLKEGHMKQAVACFQPIEHVETTFAHTPHESEKINKMIPSTSLEDSDTIFVETCGKELTKPSLKDRKQEEIFEDRPSMDAKEALKRRHDLSLRQMMRLEKDSVIPYSVSKRPDIYETPKIAPWAKKEPTSKYRVESEMDIKLPTLKHNRGTRDLDYVSNRDVKFRSTRASQDSYYETRKADKYHHYKIKQRLLDSEQRPKKVKKLEGRYITDEELKLQRSVDKIWRKRKKSDKNLAKSKSWHKKTLESKESVEFDLKPQYSFFFPKLMENAEKQVKLDVNSSHLIKDIQEKFRLQAERDKKKREEEQQQKLEQYQKIKHAREEQKGKISKESGVAKKYTKSEPDRIDEELDKAKQGTKLKPGNGDKILQKAKKYLKSIPEKRDQIDGVLEKTKIDVKRISEQKEKGDDDGRDKEKNYLKEKPTQKSKHDDLILKAMKDKSGIEQKDKISVPEKPKMDFKTKPEQIDKGVEKEQNTKTEKQVLDEKLQREKEAKETLKQSRKNKEALKQQAITKSKELLKEIKSTKMKRDSSEEINVSMSKIQKFKTGLDQKDKISVSGKPKKDFKAKSEQNDKDVEKKQKTKTEKEELGEKLQNEDKEFKERLKQSRKEKEALKQQAIKKSEALLKEKKHTKKQRDSSDEIKVSMSKIQKIKSIEQEDKISVPEKPKKGFKAKSEQNAKAVEKEQKTKTEKEELDEKLQREKEDKEFTERLKQLKQSRKDKEAFNQQAVKKREEPSKEIKSTKKKLDSSEEIKVSMSKIQKLINKGEKDKSANKQEIFVKKQEEKKEKEEMQIEVKVKPSQQEAEFKKLQAEHLKKKEEALKKKKQLEYEAKVAKGQKEAGRKAKPVVLKRGDIKVDSVFSESDLILRLVRIKQAATMKPSEIDAELIKDHKLRHQNIIQRMSSCPLCLNSELELEVLSLDNKISLPKEIITDIIIGEKIFKIKRRLEKTKEPEVVPELYRKIYFVESDLPPTEIVQIFPKEAEPAKKQVLSKKDVQEIEMEPGKGVLRYALSDRTFIDKGWTMLPTEKVVRKMNVYRMRPAHPEFDWFEHNKNKRLMTYDTGERLAEFDDNGRGRWYYRSGRLALDYYDAEETNAQQRFVIYSSGEPDERGRTHPITILATFDYLGNGIVFDHAGKIRLKYNQTEGVVLDRGIGPVSHWKWHSLNDPPVLQQVMIDTQMAHKDPSILKLGSAADRITRPDNEEMLAIEFDNFIKEKSKKLSQKFKPFQIKMKALKINEHFSLKVLDQATVYLIFRDGSTNLKLNIGMILDHQEIVDTDTAEVGEVLNSLERFPARTDSLEGLQRSLAHAQRYERQHAERERRLRPPKPCISADHLTAAASPPLRLPFRTVPTGSSSGTGYCNRKPTSNLYYNTRLF